MRVRVLERARKCVYVCACMYLVCLRMHLCTQVGVHICVRARVRE